MRVVGSKIGPPLQESFPSSEVQWTHAGEHQLRIGSSWIYLVCNSPKLDFLSFKKKRTLESWIGYPDEKSHVGEGRWHSVAAIHKLGTCRCVAGVISWGRLGVFWGLCCNAKSVVGSQRASFRGVESTTLPPVSQMEFVTTAWTPAAWEMSNIHMNSRVSCDHSKHLARWRIKCRWWFLRKDEWQNFLASNCTNLH